MPGFGKLYSSIVTSSIWSEDDATLRVWVAMLATCDAEGVVDGSVPGFAHLARVTIEQMESAIDRLSSPDRYSRSPDHEGRRIAVEPGRGWRILNHGKYRDGGQARDGSRAPYYRGYRQRKADAVAAEPQEEAGPEPYLWARYCSMVSDRKPWDRKALRDALARSVTASALEAAMKQGLPMKQVIEQAEHPNGRPSGYRSSKPKRLPFEEVLRRTRPGGTP